jgi:hypothetical protein
MPRLPHLTRPNLSLLLLLCASTFLPAGQMPKKGVATWYTVTTQKAMTDMSVSASWFYTWAPTAGSVFHPASMELVPMIWDETHVTTTELNQSRNSGSSSLLAFNEPDHTDQANMTPTQALDLWLQLEGTGLRLGSPVVAANGAVAGSWLDQFMTGVQSRGYRVDFVCLHWYGGDFNAQNSINYLRNYLQAVYNRYQKPIWLTEYALINWGSGPMYPTYAQQAAFATASVAMLESLSFVERYAWFGLPPCGVGATENLYDSAGNATLAGVAYRDAGVAAVQRFAVVPASSMRSEGSNAVAMFALNGARVPVAAEDGRALRVMQAADGRARVMVRLGVR